MNPLPPSLPAVLPLTDDRCGTGPSPDVSPVPAAPRLPATRRVLAGLAAGGIESAVYMVGTVALPPSVALLVAMGCGLLASRRPAPPPLLLLIRFEAMAHLDATWTVAALIGSAAWARVCAGLVDLSRSRTVAASQPHRGLDALLALGIGLVPALALAGWTGEGSALAGAWGGALVATAALRRILRQGLAQAESARPLILIETVAQIVVVIALLALVAGTPDAGSSDPGDEGEDSP